VSIAIDVNCGKGGDLTTLTQASRFYTKLTGNFLALFLVHKNGLIGVEF
jgi:hypothetical protein